MILKMIEEQHIPGKRLGRHVEHDHRSCAFAVEVPSTSPAFNTVSWQRYGYPFNQGALGSCTGNAMAGWCNTAPKAASSVGLMHEADAIRLYSEATHLDGIAGVYPPIDTGSSGLAVCKAAKNEGLITSYRHAFGILAALTALQTGPVITGVPWYEGFDTPDANGHVEIAGQIRGGHEFEVFAFMPVGSSYLDGIIGAWQSWGRRWGLHGKFFFTVRMWAELLSQQGDVTVPVL